MGWALKLDAISPGISKTPVHIHVWQSCRNMCTEFHNFHVLCLDEAAFERCVEQIHKNQQQKIDLQTAFRSTCCCIQTKVAPPGAGTVTLQLAVYAHN